MNYKKLEQKIITSYTEGVSLQDAEKLAAEFLSAQIAVSEELKKSAIMARLLKAQVKSTRAEVLLAEVAKVDKKPSDSMLQALVDVNGSVNTIQTDFDTAEEEANELERTYNIFRDAHIYYRGISRAKFE